ncbi:transcription termination/antitermination protein NusA [bacterium]|nr:transcription termination/antitermination protein NusA [candidate division CSSED10-310 bacterium]
MKTKKGSEGEILSIIEQICREKGISTDVMIEAIEMAVSSAAKRHLNTNETIETHFDRQTAEMEIVRVKQIVEAVEDPDNEMTLEQARQYGDQIELGDQLEIPMQFDGLSRIAAQTAKQVIVQRMREAERDMIHDHYSGRVGQLVNGSVQRVEKGNIIVDLGRAEAVLPKKEQSPRDSYRRGERIRAYLMEVNKTSQGPQIVLSRTHANLLHRLFEMEVPEIYERVVEIRGAAREPGERAKVCVVSHDNSVDPVGACVGMKGSRVQAIVKELRGENIDVVEWTDDTSQFIRNALSPAQVNSIYLTMETNTALVVVADQQLSLAIGKRGQNVRLAAKLTGWKIDIKSEVDMQKERALNKMREELLMAELSELPGLNEELINGLLLAGYTSYGRIFATREGELVERVKGIGPAKARLIKEHAAKMKEHEPQLEDIADAATIWGEDGNK